MEIISQKNKILFLFHIFAIGLTDSLLFIGIGKLLIDKLNSLILKKLSKKFKIINITIKAVKK